MRLSSFAASVGLDTGRSIVTCILLRLSIMTTSLFIMHIIGSEICDELL